VLGEVLDLKSGDHEFATFTVNVAQVRCRRDDSLQAIAHHVATVASTADRSTWTVIHMDGNPPSVPSQWFVT
jgi:predicted RNA-binding protein Jag